MNDCHKGRIESLEALGKELSREWDEYTIPLETIAAMTMGILIKMSDFSIAAQNVHKGHIDGTETCWVSGLLWGGLGVNITVSRDTDETLNVSIVGSLEVF